MATVSIGFSSGKAGRKRSRYDVCREMELQLP
jgi:hypothetical protein